MEYGNLKGKFAFCQSESDFLGFYSVDDSEVIGSKPFLCRQLNSMFSNYTSWTYFDFQSGAGNNCAGYHSSQTQQVVIKGIIFKTPLDDLEMSKVLNEKSLPLVLQIVRSLRGSFCGLVFDSKSKSLLLFSDQVNSRPLFTCTIRINGQQQFWFGTRLFDLAKILQSSGNRIDMSELGSLQMLTYGYMLGEITPLENFLRLRPSSYVFLNGTQLIKGEYSRFLNEPQIERSDQAIDALEDSFRHAVKLATDHLDGDNRLVPITLSGGLDSRTVLMHTNRLRMGRIASVTTSVSGSLDETIAKEISERLNIPWSFLDLAGGWYLENLRKSVQANDGLVLAAGSAHFLELAEGIAKQNFPILLTGMLGDAIMGTYLHGNSKHEHRDCTAGAQSNRFRSIALEVSKEEWNRWPNDELFLLHNRGFNGVMNGHFSTRHLIPTYSPFLDPDFSSIALSIHPKLRSDRIGANIYRDWLKIKVRESMLYRWERTGLRPTINPEIAWAAMKFRGILRKSKLPLFHSMMDFEKLGDSKSALMRLWANEFSDTFPRFHSSTVVTNICKELFLNGNLSEKSQVLTLLLTNEILLNES